MTDVVYFLMGPTPSTGAQAPSRLVAECTFYCWPRAGDSCRELEKVQACLAAIAQISQGPNGEVRVRLHDKHAALVSIGHLGMFTDHFKVEAVYGISEEPMSAEEWKKQFVKEG